MKTIWWGILLSVLLVAGASAQAPQLIGYIQDSTLFGLCIRAAGDQNGDGFDDVWIFRFPPRVSLYFGGNVVNGSPVITIDSLQPDIARVLDVNGDGYDDAAILSRTPHHWKANLYICGPGMDTLRDGWFGVDAPLPLKNITFLSDLNLDGRPEISYWRDDNISVALHACWPSADSIPDLTFYPPNRRGTNYAFGWDMCSGDFNGDGTVDLAIGFPRQDQLHERGEVYFYWGGTSIDTIPDFTIAYPGDWIETRNWYGAGVENAGDVNGDGFEDLLTGPLTWPESTAYIYFGGPAIDTIPDVHFMEYCKLIAPAGDINHDGYADVFTSRYASLLSVGEVRLYLGGTQMDATADWVMHVTDLPCCHTDFGIEVAGIGDYTGDGIDDFAIASNYSVMNGRVYIYAGWQDPTDVDESRQPELPSTFRLSVPYPNPFNAVLTIPFEVDERQHVTIEVCNALGQKVAIILDKEMSAGEHRVTWRAEGTPSGVFFVRAVGKYGVQTKRVVMVK